MNQLKKSIDEIDIDVFHTINLNLYGIYVKNQQSQEIKNGLFKYPEINIILPTCVNGDVNSVPRKIPIVDHTQTPYSLVDNSIYYGEKKIFTDTEVHIVPLKDGLPNNYKGFSFSFKGTKTPFVELRINPRNTGHCPGKCHFCHRSYSHREKPTFNGDSYTSIEIINSIISEYGINIFKEISHVSIITELFGSENKFIEFFIELKSSFLKYGCSNEMKIGACSQDVRSLNGLKRLYEIVNPKKYSYTLETFSRREEIMSKYKGIPMNEVKEILLNARKVGFNEIKINYIAGIDSYIEFEKNIVDLHDLNIIDSIGLSIFTTFFSDQKSIRHPEAMQIEYYLKIIKLIKDLGIKFYKPDCYEMGLPLKLLENQWSL